MYSDYQQILQNALEEIKRSVTHPNVLILGKCGAGKSTLANLVFGTNTFSTGSSAPVTKGISYLSSIERGIGIFDSQGYELGPNSEKQFYEEVVTFAAKPSQHCAGQSVHLCWYCIPAEQERIQPIDIKTITELRSYGIPTALILTKSDLLDVLALSRLVKIIIPQLPPNVPLFRLAKIKLLDGSDIEALCDWSKQSLPTALQGAFIRAQRAKLKIKTEAASQIVRRAAERGRTLAINMHGEGAMDRVISHCVRMTAEILYVFEMEEMEASFGGVTGLIADNHKFVSFVGLLLEKFTEFVGHIVGGDIGRVAGSYLGAILSGISQAQAAQKIVSIVGQTLIEICSSLAEDSIQGQKFDDTTVHDLQETFRRELHRKLHN